MKIGEREFELGALNFKALRKITPFVTGTKAITGSDEDLDLLRDVVASSIRRGGCKEDLKEFLEEELTLANLPLILPAIIGASGYQPGELKPVAASGLTTTGMT